MSKKWVEKACKWVVGGSIVKSVAKLSSNKKATAKQKPQQNNFTNKVERTV